MSDAPERIFACYDPAFDATYWVGPNKVYLSRHSVGEYIRADKVAALVIENERLRDALGKTIAIARAAMKEDFLDAATSEWVRDTLHRLAAALEPFKGGTDA